jgi:hypothetical protein
VCRGETDCAIPISHRGVKFSIKQSDIKLDVFAQRTKPSEMNAVQ